MLKILTAATTAAMILAAYTITPTAAGPLHSKGIQEKAAKADEFSSRRRRHRRVYRRVYRPHYAYRPYYYRPYYYRPYYRPYPYYAYGPAPLFPFSFGFGFGPRYWW